MAGIHCALAQRWQLPAAARLVREVVTECVSAWLEPEAVATFLTSVTAQSVVARWDAGHQFWIARGGSRVVGTLEVKGASHVLMLFVAREFQRRGVGRAFPGFPDFRLTLTVNSAPPSIPAYERMGFVRDGDEQNVDGIRFVPMKLAATK